jgi:hypothetical protein
MLGVGLTDCASGCGGKRFRLPPHVRERLVAAAHLDAVAKGELPNDGLPLAETRLGVTGEEKLSAIEVGLAAGGRSCRRRFERVVLLDDVQALVGRLSASGELARGLYDFALVELPEPKEPASRLRVAPFPRALPPLPVVSLREAGIPEPRCPHPTILVPRESALRLVAHARANPEVEVGALLLVTPFLVAEDVPVRLAVRVAEAVPLAEGTTGDASKLCVPPAALAAVPEDPARGRHQGGLAHSHPTGEGAAHFLSADDRLLASSFFWRPHQLQIVIDPRESDPQHALAAFAWVGARLAQVCFRVIDETS